MLSQSAPARTILFVDDQPDVTSALELAFHKQPFRVHTANSAQEALEILPRVSVDAVISDERMPVTTGTEFLSILRREYPDIVRIILSGQADMSAILAAINDAQAHHFLLKPCSPHDIAACIAKAIDEKERRNGAASARAHQTERDRLKANQDFDSAQACLWVAFQPIVRAKDASVFAYEALIRSDYPNFHTPSQLFGIATECRAVEQLERSIRTRIGQDATRIPASANLMVNIDPSSLRDDDLFSETSPLFAHRSRIVLEITEREKLHEISGIDAALSRLRELGYRIAIDDLGAGYAGLNSFALMRPDIVKFDMELIRDIHHSSTKKNLVRTLAQLCRDMDIVTVAEGIETAEEADVVTELGCDLLQGHYLGHPERIFEGVQS